MVRLEEGLSLSFLMVTIIFQFQYGTIRSFLLRRFCVWINHFNSSMVRLEVIKSEDLTEDLRFQFQYGTIRRLTPTEKEVLKLYFNSSMVRLEEDCLAVE